MSTSPVGLVRQRQGPIMKLTDIPVEGNRKAKEKEGVLHLATSKRLHETVRREGIRQQPYEFQGYRLHTVKHGIQALAQVP